MKLSLKLHKIRFIQVTWQDGKYSKNECCPGWLDDEYPRDFIFSVSSKYQGPCLLKKIYTSIYEPNRHTFLFTPVGNFYDVGVYDFRDLVQRHFVKIVETDYLFKHIRKVFF